MIRASISVLICGLLVGIPVAKTSAQAVAGREMLTFFESRIRPVLIEHCYDCHSRDTTDPGGGLRLDSQKSLLRGGGSGPAIVAGKPESSLLLLAMRHTEAKLAMPPADAGEKLPATVLADFERWIRMGAFDPREDEDGLDDLVTPKQGWVWQPLKSVPPPTDASGWAQTEIDRFVVAQLNAHAIAPVDDADRATLIRRLAIDLTGLPPSPADYREFVIANPSRPIEDLVDRYLASPEFGVRFGRQWLDVARFAESSGRDVNLAHPHAWRYRDYVIDAFNADMPFDQFIREQIAGDLLVDERDNAVDKARKMIATGFLAVGAKSLNEMRAHQFALDLADEQIDAVSQTFLGLTVACARCHDHKFDPISQRDYTALAGVFLSTKTLYGTAGGVGGRNQGELFELPKDWGGDHSVRAVSPAELEAKQKRLDTLKEQQRDTQEELRQARRAGEAGNQAAGANLLRINSQVLLLEAEVNGYYPDGSPKPQAMAVVDKPLAPRTPMGRGRDFMRGQRPGLGGLGGGRFSGPFDLQYQIDSPQLIRGELERPGDRVPRVIPAFQAGGPTQPVSSGTSGRLELAEAIASPDNPMTSRVIANRVWAWTIGKGLVSSVDNFGNSGELPSHPELLDHLADSLIQNDWSIKSLVKQIVISRTYALSSDSSISTAEQSRQADADNRLIWRANLKPMTAEALRDGMLAASGMLDTQRPIGSLVSQSGDGVIGGRRFVGLQESQIAAAEGNYRSIYLPQPRQILPDVLELFDMADNSLVSGMRESTIVPSQSLYWLNSPRVHQLADGVARQIIGLPQATESQGNVSQGNGNTRPMRPLMSDQFAGRANDMGGSLGEFQDRNRPLASERFRAEMMRRRAVAASAMVPREPIPPIITDETTIRARTKQMTILILSRDSLQSESDAVVEFVNDRARQGDDDLKVWTAVSKSFFSSGDFRFLK